MHRHDLPAPSGPTTALFTVPRGGVLAAGADFYSLPFPNDFWRSPGGSSGINLSLYPRPTELLANYADAMAPRLDGFGLNAAIFTRFDGAIDPATLPSTAVAANPSVYLVDVLAGSPERGTLWPLQFRFEANARATIGPNWLSALPQPGSPLREQHTYALVVTTRLHGSDGTSVRPSSDWLAVRGGAPLADPDLVAARTAAQPLLDWLDEARGDERTDVVSAAVFTTQTSRDMMIKLRQRIAQLPIPGLSNLVKTGTTLTHKAYDGNYRAPNFQTGTVPYSTSGGEIVPDPGDDLPLVQSTEVLRVSFTTPLGAMPASGWPVVLYAHGTGGNWHTFQTDGTAARLAQKGLAVISIDQVLHGTRMPSGSPATAFFNFANPLAARNNVIQGAADQLSLARVVLNPPVIVGTDTIAFDAAHITFFGHSQGGLTGPPFLAVEGSVQGAVLSGTGGVSYLSMLHKTQPIDVAATIQRLVADGPLDQFHPVLALLQTWLERADPVNYGRLLTTKPLTGIASKAIFLSEGLGDVHAPAQGIEALTRAIGCRVAEPVLQPVSGLASDALPVSANVLCGDGVARTVVLAQYQPPVGSDAHFVLFELPIAQTQSARFLETLTQTGSAIID